jgi:flagellar FliL protein
MASSAEAVEATSNGQSGPGILPLLIATVTAVVIAMLLLGGGMYYLAKSGRLAALLGTPATSVKTEQTAPPPTHAIALEPVVVNLADEGGKTFLRIGITLRVLDAELPKGEKPKEENSKDTKSAGDAEAAVRDTALEVLGRQTAEELLAADGKEHLKTELKAAIEKHNPDQKVTDVFFTEFLVQR